MLLFLLLFCCRHGQSRALAGCQSRPHSVSRAQQAGVCMRPANILCALAPALRLVGWWLASSGRLSLPHAVKTAVHDSVVFCEMGQTLFVSAWPLKGRCLMTALAALVSLECPGSSLLYLV